MYIPMLEKQARNFFFIRPRRFGKSLFLGMLHAYYDVRTKEEFNQMLGFSTEDVRDIFTYYKNRGEIPADSDIEAIIQDMKPWYDNYCFSKICSK